MPRPTTSRRSFLSTAAGAALATGVRLPLATAAASAATTPSPNERPVFGWIGSGIRFHNLIGDGCAQGPVAAIADVDAVQRGRGIQSARVQHERAGYPMTILGYEDYRRVLDRSDIDAVVIATPDHWHAKMAIEALQAGKHVYCEKPLALTIGEGRAIADAAAKSDRVFQVGTMQRTQFDRRFATAAAMVRDDRVGPIRRVTCAIGGALWPFPIPLADPPKHLNWDLWLGPAPAVPYRASEEIAETTGYGAGHPASRAHKYYRWWYEYSGGKLTDWGAHHVDIAMWALDREDATTKHYTIDPIRVSHPNPMDENGVPVHDDRYNTATSFQVRVTFEDGVEIDIVDTAEKTLGFGNGAMFQGDDGRFFVNRGKLTGKPVEELAANPLADDALDRLYGRSGVARNHMADFVDCIRTGATPASDVESNHRNLTVCHAANIAMRLGRKLVFDPATESFVGDSQANTFLNREPRKGFELPA